MQPVANFNPSAGTPQAAAAFGAAGSAANKTTFDLLMAISMALDTFVATPKKNSNENSPPFSIGFPEEFGIEETPNPAAGADEPDSSPIDADTLALLMAASPLAPLFQPPVADPSRPVTDLKTAPPPAAIKNAQTAPAEASQQIVSPQVAGQTWNLRDLAWQLRAALRQVVPNPAGDATATVRPNPLNKTVPTKSRQPIAIAPQLAETIQKLPAELRLQPPAGSAPSNLMNASEKPGVKFAEIKLAEFSRLHEAPQSQFPTQSLTPQSHLKIAPELIAVEAAPNTSFGDQLREVIELVADRAHGAIRVGDKGVEATMRLYPPDLGTVRVSLHVQHDSSVQARFIAESPETAALIQKHLPQLQEAFTRQGLAVERIQVSSPIAATAQTSDSGNSLFNQQSPERHRHDLWNQHRRQQDPRNPYNPFEELPA